jgi:predicted dehydrogenase
MRIAIIGYGSIAERHARNLRALGVHDLVGYDPSPERTALGRAADIRMFGSRDEALAQGAAAALICTPTALHASDALAALAANHHVFIEKPIAASVRNADRVLRAARKQRKLVVVGCNMRFYPAIAFLKKLITRGDLGKALSARLEFGHYLPAWRPQQDYRASYSAKRGQGGVILDAIHELDVAQWLFGPVSRVFCAAGRASNLEIETEDYAKLILTHRALVTDVHLDYLQQNYTRGIKIIGERTTAQWRIRDGVYAFRPDPQNRLAGTWEKILDDRAYDSNAAYREELKAFLASIAENRTRAPLLDGNEARQVLALALAATQSAQSHKEVRIHGPKHQAVAALA